MAEGLRSEQQARQQAQNEIMKGLKNEENARQVVQKDLAVMKEEIKNLTFLITNFVGYLFEFIFQQR